LGNFVCRELIWPRATASNMTTPSSMARLAFRAAWLRQSAGTRGLVSQSMSHNRSCLFALPRRWLASKSSPSSAKTSPPNNAASATSSEEAKPWTHQEQNEYVRKMTDDGKVGKGITSLVWVVRRKQRERVLPVLADFS